MKQKKGPSYSITRLVVGQLATNCYIVADASSRTAVIVDPGGDAQYIAGHVQSLGVTPTAIVATHGHFDHILASSELKGIFHIPFLIHKDDRFLVTRMHETALHFLGSHIVEPAPAVDRYIGNGEEFPLGGGKLKIIGTPGHTPGSISIVVSKRVVLVGDTIFAGGAVGRTDFSYSKPELLATSIRTILSNPADTVLYSGHGDETTVGGERPYHVQ